MSKLGNLETDIASKMLSALVLGYPEEEEKPIPVPVEEQKRYIKRYIDVINVDDRIGLGNILIINDKRNCLHSCPEGTVINLDAIEPDIIEQMYNLISYKMSKRG